MLLAKTDKGRIAIQSRDAGLSAQERHILIISNGQRSLNDVVAMLGPATLAPIDRLLREGFLSTAAEAAPAALPPVETAINGMGTLLRASRELAGKVQGRAQAVIAAATAASPAEQERPTLVQQLAITPAPVPPPRPSARRSMAAARMYMLDMLQLQRSVEAATLKVAIQSSNGGEESLAALIEALRHLQQVAAPSYYARVTTRLGEVIPEEFVPRLAAASRVIAASASAAA